MCLVIETSYECIPTNGENSKQGNSRSPPLLSWSKNVAPLKRQYHQAVKQAKKLASALKAMSLLQAVEAGDIMFMKEVSKSVNRRHFAQSVPSCFEGEFHIGLYLISFGIVIRSFIIQQVPKWKWKKLSKSYKLPLFKVSLKLKFIR